MAIKPSVAYAGQVDVTDLAAYPNGKAQNDLVEGDGFGTPLERTWVNDVWGFLQALLTRSGIDASGVADNAIESQYTDAVKVVAQSAHAVFFVRSYGAVGDGIEDDSTAVNDAIQACHDAGGGIVMFDPGDYLLNATIILLPNVSLEARGRVVLWINNATATFVDFSGTSLITQRISGFQLEGLVVNTGAIFRSLAGVSLDVIVENCKINKQDDKLRRYLLFNDSSSVAFVETEVSFSQTTRGIESGGGHLKFHRCELKNFSPAFTVPAIAQTTGQLTVTDCQILLLGAGSGAQAIWFSASTTALITGNRFTGYSLSDAVYFEDNAFFEAGANYFSGGIVPYASNGTAAPGSQLGPTTPLNLGVGTSAPVTIPRYATSVYIRSTYAGGPPTILFDTPLWAGQGADLFVLNDSGSDWTSPVVVGGANYSNQAELDDLPTTGWVSARFGVMRGNVSRFWTQVGAWARSPL